MKVLVINAGSSSIKYQLIDVSTEQALCKGIVEKIGIDGSNLEQKTGDKVHTVKVHIANHTEALSLVLRALTDPAHGAIKSVSEIKAVGHRVIHAPDNDAKSVVVTQKTLVALKAKIPLAPLHMPPHVQCIESCMQVMPGVPMIGVFDTGFHSTMPAHAYMYAIPYEDSIKYDIRRYGFHGTSHRFVTAEAIKYLGKKHGKIITVHLGNGSSMSAVKDGKSVDTTMGLTPLEGLVMGTRSGDLDPAVVDFLGAQKGMSSAEVINYLNKKSGFLGIAGVSDFRDLTAKAKAGDERAILAIDMFAYRIKKYIGAYAAALNGVDAIVLTGGIGENASYAREKVMTDMDFLGIDFDFNLNSNAPRGKIVELTKPSSKVKVLVIPTNEELVIARDAAALAK